MPQLMVVDDSQSICWGIAQLGREMGLDVASASSSEEALAIAAQSPPDVVVLDVRLPGLDGLSAMEKFRSLAGNVPIIIITAYGDLDTAVRAVRNEAFDYVLKPFELTKIESVLQRALIPLSKREAPPGAAVSIARHGMIGDSLAIHELFKEIAMAASSTVEVLLQGESGTGKELAARAIHAYSNMSDGPFVAVNVAALNPSLVESELFGHVPGAFTGAESEHVGFLARANGGTLFMDEVADIPIVTQIKLLRCIEYGQFTPVGSTESVESTFRVISATHQDLEQLIRAGLFRHDLYYRLCGYQIALPPLRERGSDVLQLAEEFAREASADGTCRFAEETRRELTNRPWHGNVRELRGAIIRACAQARGGVIYPEHLPESLSCVENHPAYIKSTACGSTESTQKAVADAVRRWATQRLKQPNSEAEGDLHAELLRLVELPLFRATLEYCGGQWSAAARRLGLHRTTLKRRLHNGNPQS